MASRKPTSLLRRLLAAFMLVMLGIWVLAVAHIAWQVQVGQERQVAIVNKAWARQIMVGLRAAAADPRAMLDIGSGIEQLRLDMYREVGMQSNARTVIRKDGKVLYDSAGTPGAAVPEGWVSWTEHDAKLGITVERSEKPGTDWLFTPSAVKYLFTPLVYSLPFLLIPAWFIVRIGLRPLRTIAGAVERRSAADLSPLPHSRYRELAPLVDAINSLMSRLSERLAREREFLADAAHELKTPLSVVQINAHLLDSPADDAQRREAGEGLRHGVARATRTVHQLLALERTRAEAGDALANADLAELVRTRLALAAPLAMQRAIELVLEAERPCVLPLHRESMGALVDNLVSNAIKYAPDGSRVEVKVGDAHGRARLTVTDQGPGIEPALRAKVFERFYRIPGQDQPGTGLGLSIAERAAERHGATIRLDDGPEGRGLAVIVEFGHPALAG